MLVHEICKIINRVLFGILFETNSEFCPKLLLDVLYLAAAVYFELFPLLTLYDLVIVSQDSDSVWCSLDFFDGIEKLEVIVRMLYDIDNRLSVHKV